LLFLTLGLYVFAWAYFARRATAAILEREDQPIWKTVALIVPIFNFFLMFELGKRIEGVAWRANPSTSESSLPWLGLSLFVFTVLGRLKGPYSWLSVLVFVPIAFLQRSLSRAQISLLGDAGLPTRLHWAEIVVIGLGFVWWVLIVIGVVFSVRDGELSPYVVPWFFGSLALAALMLAYIWVVSRNAIREGLAMHAAATAIPFATELGGAPE